MTWIFTVDVDFNHWPNVKDAPPQISSPISPQEILRTEKIIPNRSKGIELNIYDDSGFQTIIDFTRPAFI